MFKSMYFVLFLICFLLPYQSADALNKAYCKCRTNSSPRIVGGKNASPNEYPWTVSLGILPDTPWDIKPGLIPIGTRQNLPDRFKEATHVCGGVIISENLILTAAHCVTDDKLRTKKASSYGVGYGRSNLIDLYDHGRVRIQSIHVHPQYNVTSKDTSHDIAVLKLASPLKFNSKSVMPSCFLQENEVGKMKNYNEVTATGWGSTSVMTFNFLTRTWQGYKASQKLKEAVFKDISHRSSICLNNNKVICIGPLDALHVNESVCKGDSGGALQYNLEGYTFIVGLTSFGSTKRLAPFKMQACAGEAGYTRIASSLDWLKSITGNNICLFEHENGRAKLFSKEIV